MTFLTEPEDPSRRTPLLHENLSSRERYVLFLFERFLEWRRIAYPNLWNRTTDLKIEMSETKEYILTGIRLEERRDLIYSSSRSSLIAKMDTAIREWTECDTLEEADIFLSSLGF